jgi:transglycosylase-like protein with SLT domain
MLATIVAGVFVLFAVAFAGVLAAVFGTSGCAGAGIEADASAHAEQDIPARYLELYRDAGHRYGVPWPVLAGIGSIETDHGRLDAPGVRSGVNRFGCCAGPMQFNLTDGPTSTWTRYGVDGNDDGRTDVYDPEDAIPSAGNYLRALLQAADGNLSQAILGYNHSQAYVNDVLARARAYADDPTNDLAVEAVDSCAGGGIDAPVGPGELTAAERVPSPREFRELPAWAMAAGRAPELVDARLYDDVVWILRRYHLRVSAAREAGHRTHGDGTAVDLVPADGVTQTVWDASAGRLAHDLGWRALCAASGSRPACALVPAIQFIGYDGYPSHGSPRTCAGQCPAHIHLSWVSPCFGSSALTAPCAWVMTFPAPSADDPSST